MPDYTVSGDVDSMLRSANDAAIRSAIGVGTTDSPTFLAQTLTGQSLTGTQATSLVDLSATWNTSGTPSAIKLNVTETGAGSNAASNLMDLQVGGVSKFKVNKEGLLALPASGGNGGGALFGGSVFPTGALYVGQYGVRLAYDVALSWASGTNLNVLDLNLVRDGAAGILAQRNGTNAQAFRVYDSYTDASNFCRANLSFNSSRFELSISSLGTGSTTRGFDIGTNGTGDITFFSGGSNRWRIGGPTGHLLAMSDNAFDIGANGANRPRFIYVVNCYPSNIQLQNSEANYGWIGRGGIFAPSDGVVRFSDSTSANFNRLQLGGTTDAFPAIARDGAGIKFTGAAAGSTSWIKIPAVAVSALPAAATAGVGARSFVSDALTPVFGSAVTGGGAVTVPVYSTGSAWNVG